MSLQYVGARYVPKFIDTPWSDTNEYEALTVVAYDGSTFISKKPVPVGIAISNMEYWVMYSSGGSDPRVPQIIADVATLQGDVATLQTDVAAKADASTVQALETTVAGKADQTALDTVSGDVATLQTDVAAKADASTVQALETTVASKADASTVTAVETQLANSHTQYLHTFNNFTAASGDWSGWYQSAHAATIYNESGSVRAAGATLDAPATDAMKEVVFGMEFVAGSDTVTAYAKTQPAEAVTVAIEGVQ